MSPILRSATFILVVLVFVLPVVSFSLPQVVLPGNHVMDATSLQTPAYAESNFATILGEGNWSQWTLSPGQNGASLSHSSNGLLLTGTFPVSNAPVALSIASPLKTNLTAFPIFYTLINVSKGVSYGVRFYTQSAGILVPLWAENDALQHRPGTGQPENLQMNVPHLIASNIGRYYNTADSVTIYIEKPASAQQTDFSLQIKTFEFLNYPFTPVRAPGSYHGIYIGLNQIQQTASVTLRSLQISGRIDVTASTVLVPYFISRLSVYPGTVTTLATTDTDLSFTITLSTQSAKSFSDAMPVGETAIVLIAASGMLNQFTVKSISMNYFSQTATTSSQPSLQTRNSYATDAFFILLLPAAVILLVHDQLRKTKSSAAP